MPSLVNHKLRTRTATAFLMTTVVTVSLMLEMWPLGATASRASGAPSARSSHIKSATVSSRSTSISTNSSRDSASPNNTNGRNTTRPLTVFPMGFFTTTTNFEPGQTYVLLDGGVQRGTDPFAYIDFNGNLSANVFEAWQDCGYNPQVDAEGWEAWTQSQNCQEHSNIIWAAGPTHHYPCVDPDCYIPEDNPVVVPYLRWGQGSAGWWLAGDEVSGDSCGQLDEVIHNLNNRDFDIPIFDRTHL